MIQQKDKTRIDNLDLLKALAIYLVINGHFNSIPSNIIECQSFSTYLNLFLKSIFSTCVPIFFFVNGLLLLNKETIDIRKHIRKIIRIIVLTVLWGFITLFVLQYIRGEILPFSQIIKKSWLLKQGWNNHLWFLRTLVVIYVFYPLIHTVYHTNKKIFYFFFACVMLFTFGNVIIGQIATILSYFSNKFVNTNFELNYFSDFNPFSLFYEYSIAYFMLGAIARDLFSSLSDNYKRKVTVLAKLVIPVSMLCLTCYAVIVSLRSKEMWDIGWNGLDTIFTLINVVALYVISYNYKTVGWLGDFISYIGKNSLGIYFIHIIVGDFFNTFFAQFEYSNLFIINLIYAFIILISSLLLTMILKKTPILRNLVSI